MLMVLNRSAESVERRGTRAASVLPDRSPRARGFTLIELLIAMGIAFTALAALAFGYMQAYRISDSAVLQAAAQRLAVDRLEMVRNAEWQYYGTQPTNQLTNFVGTLPMSLRVPAVTSLLIAGNVVTTVGVVNTNPPLARIQVDCIWTGPNGFVYTNSVTTLRAPD